MKTGLFMLLLCSAGSVLAQTTPVSTLLLPPPPPNLRNPMVPVPVVPNLPPSLNNVLQAPAQTVWIVRKNELGVWQVHHEGQWLARGQRIGKESIVRISEKGMTLRSASGDREVAFTKNYMRMHKEQK